MSRPTTMKVDGTVYWAIFTYTDAGVLVDADSTPSVAVRKNGAAVGDAVTITKRAATTGIYDCSHNPAGEVDGDTFGYEETVTISAQAYLNRWSLEVQATAGGGGGDATAANQATIIADIAALNDFDPAADTVLNVTNVAVNADMRGTDGANTVVPVDVSSDVTAILADTNELQQNQGQWLTATGFNTVAPDNASIAAILADTNELQTNQGDWATATTTVASNMRGTDNALLASAAPSNWSILSINGSGQVDATGSGSGGDSASTIYAYFTASNREDAFKATGFNTIAPDNASITAILADTNELQGNQGDWATATGFATPADVNASQGVVTAAISGLNDFDPALDVVAHVTLVDTTTDLTNGGGGGDCPTAQEIVDAWGNQDQSVYATQGTLGYYLDAQVSSAGSGGTGLYQTTVRVQDSNGDALQGARVNVDGTTLTLTTGTSGEVTFNLDSGVYLLEVSPPANYDTPLGQVVTITNTDPSDTVFALTSTLPPGGCSPPWIG